MIHDYVPWFLILVASLTYALELWTGTAYSASSTKGGLVQRAERPGLYWFVMIVQTILLLAASLVLLNTR